MTEWEKTLKKMDMLCLKLALLLAYKPNNIHRFSLFTNNPYNKYGTKYSLLKYGTNTKN